MTTATQATFPGFPFPNTTQIPNDVFDSLMPSLSGGELKVLLYICRRTFGFQKDSDRISLAQIAHGITTKTGKVLDHGTGLCKRQVINALKTLEKKNIIIITRTVDETGLNAINTYRLNIRQAPQPEEAHCPQRVVHPSAQGVVNSGSPGVVNPSALTKQREQKKEEQNKDSDDDVVIQTLENFGMTPSGARFLAQQYPAAYIKEKLAMTHGLLAEGSALVAKNPVGWLRRAIEENYKLPRKKVRPTPVPRIKSQKQTGIPAGQQREKNIIITPPVELPKPDRQTELLWQQTVNQLQAAGASEETQTKLTGTMLLTVTDTQAMICAPNQSTLLWLERRYYKQIAHALKGVVGKDLDLQFVTSPL